MAVIASKRVAKFKDLDVWHERGFIRVRNPNTGEQVNLNVAKFRQRLVPLLDEFAIARKNRGSYEFIFEGCSAAHWIRFFEDASFLIQEAMHYGDPTNLRTLRERGEMQMKEKVSLFIPGAPKPQTVGGPRIIRSVT